MLNVYITQNQPKNCLFRAALFETVRLGGTGLVGKELPTSIALV